MADRTDREGIQLGAPEQSAASSVRQNQARVGLVVLGMHRSGTSALTRLLSIAGAKLPKDRLGAGEGNERGHWEPLRLVALHDAILAECGSRWDDWQALDLAQLAPARRAEIKSEIRSRIDADYGDDPLIVVKDPRICRFAPLFLGALEDGGYEIRVIIPIRNPLEVATSLESRPSVWSRDHTITTAGLLWLRHVLDAEVATRQHSRAIISFDRLLTNQEDSLDLLAEKLGTRWPYTRTEISPQVRAFLDVQYRHHNYTNEELRDDPRMPDWISEAYEALLVLERNPNSEHALRALDRIRREFDNAAPLLARVRLDERLIRDGLETEVAHLKECLERVESENQRARQEAEAALQNTKWEAEAFLQSAKSNVQRLEDSLATAAATYQAQRHHLQSDLDAAKSQVTEMMGRLIQLQSEVERALEEGYELKKEVTHLSGLLAQREAQVEEIKERLAQSQARGDALESSVSWRITAPLRAVRRAIPMRRDKPRNLIRERESLFLRRVRAAYDYAARHGPMALAGVVGRKLRRATPGSVLSPKFDVWAHYPFLHHVSRNDSALDRPPESKTVNWFIPPFGFGSGGHLNICRFISLLEERGFQNRIIIVGEPQPKSKSVAGQQIREWFFPVAADVILEGDDVPSAKFNFATSWQTAYNVRALSTRGKKLYFVQDFEPHFYAPGTDYVLADETYRFGFLGVTAGTWLSEKLSTEYGMQTVPLAFSYDRERYRPLPRREPGVRRVLFYARPPTPRRGFELGLLALFEVVKALPDVKVIFAGWDISNYSIPFEHLNAGVIALDDLPDLYSQCDVCLILSFTNLSLLPLEVMACGLPVVSNRGPNTEWLLHEGIARLADPTPEALSASIVSLLENPEQRRRLSDAGLLFTKETNWAREGDKLANLLRNLEQ